MVEIERSCLRLFVDPSRNVLISAGVYTVAQNKELNLYDRRLGGVMIIGFY